jgi:ribonuclease G
VREVTDIKTAEKCPSCDGKGIVEAPILFSDSIENSLRYIAEEGKHKEVSLLVHPMVEAYITKGWWWNRLITKWRKTYKIKINLEANSSVQFLEYHIYDTQGEELQL